MAGLERATGEAAMGKQLQHQFATFVQRAHAGRRAGKDHITRLQAEVTTDVLDHRQDRVEHVAAVTVLTLFTVNGQADADRCSGMVAQACT